jgi:hypothetical protein
VVELLKPRRGGFLRPFGCGWFIREFLMGNGPHGSPHIDLATGAPQADIFHHYKEAILRATALDRATDGFCDSVKLPDMHCVSSQVAPLSIERL